MMKAGVVEGLQKAFMAGKYSPFIKEIIFPHFKNLDHGLTIKFDFPVTAIIAPNGANKSSILRALQACPDQYSISDYWFDTSLDTIDSQYGPQRYIHTYSIPSGKDAEVIKVRISKTDRGDDYFETARPRVKDGMNKMPDFSEEDKLYRNQTRWKPIDKNVVYLDCRYMISAYDVLMNFDWRKRDSERSVKKKIIRKKSSYVAKVLNDLSESYKLWNSERVLSPAEELSEEEIQCVQEIIGKKYEEIRLVKHDFFGCIGWTAVLKSNDLKYSEAFAGSGEFAAIMLVRSIFRAPERSLILLDEPETSLHPGAQKMLEHFLCEQALKKKHQIIYATHSQSMVDLLPDSGRKLLGINQTIENSYVFMVSEAARLDEAFGRLGAYYDPKTLIVEDSLSEEIIKKALRSKGEDYFNSISTCIVPGGADTILNYLVQAEARINSKCLVFIDGDMEPDSRHSLSELNDQDVINELKNRGIHKSLFVDGGNDPTDHKIDTAKVLLKWFDEHVYYLPGRCCPEELLIRMAISDSEKNHLQPKDFWVMKTRKELGRLESEAVSSSEVLGTQIRALNNVSMDNPYMNNLITTLEGALSKLE